MTDGFVMGPGAGERVSPAMTLKVGASTAGPLDAAIAELRARHDIEQLTPQILPGRGQ
jgi:hypothetical protein